MTPGDPRGLVRRTNCGGAPVLMCRRSRVLRHIAALSRAAATPCRRPETAPPYLRPRVSHDIVRGHEFRRTSFFSADYRQGADGLAVGEFFLRLLGTKPPLGFRGSSGRNLFFGSRW